MANVTVIGAQWGDEGKGKIVDWLASRADAVVRFQGGHNAGHTLVVGNTTYKLSLLPSGIVTGTLSIIGNGVVLDPWALKTEVEKLEGQGVAINADNFAIADNCPLILPIHRDLDGLRETAAGSGKIGTTGRGIGPAYEDKVGRRAIRVCDLAHLDSLEPQLDRLCAHHDALRAGFDEPPVDRARLLGDLREIAPFVLQYAQPVWKRLKKVRKAGARILFEGAQGVLLDIDHGTYPFVTSSNTVSGTAASGSGLGPGSTGFVLGIVKAYTTRVGSGPGRPTRQGHRDAEQRRQRGEGVAALVPGLGEQGNAALRLGDLQPAGRHGGDQLQPLRRQLRRLGTAHLAARPRRPICRRRRRARGRCGGSGRRRASAGNRLRRSGAERLAGAFRERPRKFHRSRAGRRQSESLVAETRRRSRQSPFR